MLAGAKETKSSNSGKSLAQKRADKDAKKASKKKALTCRKMRSPLKSKSKSVPKPKKKMGNIQQFALHQVRSLPTLDRLDELDLYVRV